jgi:ribosomal-protein-alanine N-acetyltransferase
MNSVLLDPASGVPAAHDLAHLAALHASAFAKPWGVDALGELLAMPGSFVFHAAHGFVMARTVADEAEILTLAVAPPARRKGLGRSLVLLAASHSQKRGARIVFLEVGVANAAALALYTGLGFVQVGTRRGYYDGGDALVLRLSLAGEFA